MTKNIMIAGVGGQGTLLASKLLGSLLIGQGYDVKVSEVHGMAQRGGSVVTYVRYGERVASPIIDRGEADILVAFELLEAARWAEYLRPEGVLIANTQQILPMPVITGAAVYPEDLAERLREGCGRAVLVDALAPAEEAGSAKAVNVVLMGILSTVLGIPEAAWMAALERQLKPALVEMNKKAFYIGRAMAER
ncbi:MAG: indolepyruvate oxidoreductase subunit beta [Angelakisella sp.]|jgi:indolepyruvate ferredoxin oxidoreductase beta subunit|nr:indolepyruvate oxidoreductase subunit beta [Angelakisella sp.]MCI9529871.1 indolepyruvate oxidoreductase subunit beta [Angelakisella sp.]